MATTVPGPVESHDNDWTSAETAAGRNVGLSLWRGVRGRCPRCGRGRLFCAFLKVDDHCSVCRLDFTGHRADDLPAYLVIVIVGHRLFSAASPSPTDLAADLDPHPMQTLSGCLVERATASDPHGQALQFERQGNFTHDDASRPERLVFNRTASLRESPGKPPTARLGLLRK